MRRLQFFPQSAALLTLCTSLLLSVILAQTPLFNALGYEFSLVAGAALPLVLGLYGFSRDSPHKKLAVAFLTLALPPIVLLLNTLFVRNCTYLEGLFFYTLAAGFGGVFSVGLSLAVQSVLMRWRKTVFVSLYLTLLLAPVLWRFYASPQIFFFNHVFGFYAGSVYDETIEIDVRYFLFRSETLLWSIAFLSFAFRQVWLKSLVRLGLAGGVASASLLGFNSDSFGITSSEDAILRTLAPLGNPSPRLLAFAAPDIPADERRQLQQRLELEWRDLARLIGSDTALTIKIFIYPDAATKKKFTGADETEFTKIWKREIHITAQSFESVIRHELVHILFGEYGLSGLGISTSIGLIEGIAVALETPELDWTDDEYAAALFKLGFAPQQTEVLLGAFGFWTGLGATSYTLMGSFVRHLLDSYGLEKFKAVYARADFEEVYGKTATALIDEWKASLRSVAVAPELENAVRLRFTRKSIFQAECPHSVARLLKKASKALGEKRVLEAAALYREAMWMTTGLNPRAVSGYVSARLQSAALGLVPSGDAFREADSLAALLPQPIPIQFAIASARLWSGFGHQDSALGVLKEIAASHLSFGYEVACASRLLAASEGIEMQVFSPLLSGEERTAFLAEQLDSAATPTVKNSLIRLLKAERLIAQAKFEEAQMELQGSAALPSAVLEFHRQLLRLRAELATGDREAARRTALKVLTLTSPLTGATAKRIAIESMWMLYYP